MHKILIKFAKQLVWKAQATGTNTSKNIRTNDLNVVRLIHRRTAKRKKRYTNKLAANRPTDRHQQRKSEREQNCCYICQNYLECFVVMVACLCTPTHAHRTHTQTEHLHNHTHSIATCLGVNVNASVVDFTTHNFMLCTREIFAIFSIFERNPIYIWICIEVSHCEICFRFRCVSLSLSLYHFTFHGIGLILFFIQKHTHIACMMRCDHQCMLVFCCHCLRHTKS